MNDKIVLNSAEQRRLLVLNQLEASSRDDHESNDYKSRERMYGGSVVTISGPSRPLPSPVSTLSLSSLRSVQRARLLLTEISRQAQLVRKWGRWGNAHKAGCVPHLLRRTSSEFA